MNPGTPRHSIIIPHRNRNRYLATCLLSLMRSHGGDGGVEIVIVDAGSDRPIQGNGAGIRVVHYTSPMPIFNKSILLNAGIDAARGDILTFLDCDALVGPRFFEGVELIDWSRTHRLAYRVRYLDRQASHAVLAGGDPAYYFATYDRHRLGFEAYGRPDQNRPPRPTETAAQAWGNSQCSIPRKVLAGLRFDEHFRGRGFEDIAFSRNLHIRLGEAFRGRILTDPDHALLHLTHDYESDWSSPELLSANLDHYRAVYRHSGGEHG